MVKIWLSFDVEKWLWKSEFCYIWPSIPNQAKYLEPFYGHFHRPLALFTYSPLNSAKLSCLYEVTLNQVSALVGALSRPTTSRAPRGAAAATPRRKRKSTTRKPASGSSAKKRKTSTKRKSVKRKRWSPCAFWILEYTLAKTELLCPQNAGA